jgi:hypothetical protein
MRAIYFTVAAALTVFSAAAAFGQTDAPKGYTGAYAPAGTPPDPLFHRSAAAN